ncbi:DUF5682 family protein [Streptomyces sp. NPDC008079]|uniref:DUF5682 family protein n=1 Tax=Streptomyces sp. NPDC008079 TaxID=3364806 RepID=UPI0036E1233C
MTVMDAATGGTTTGDRAAGGTRTADGTAVPGRAEDGATAAGSGPGDRTAEGLRAGAVPAAVVRGGAGGHYGDDLVLLGVRHHGPGSARAVRAALDAYRPQAVLIEGPPEADALLALAADPAMRPPVALLAHVVDDPARAGFWPFAEFSPEWVAIRWAAQAGADVRFIDLPAAHTLALRAAAEEEEAASGGPDPEGPVRGPVREGEEGQQPAEEEAAGGDRDDGGAAAAARIDPLAVLARAAGYDDPERWWEDAVEHRGGTADGDGDGDPLVPFAALAEAMAAIRETYGDGGHAQDPLREAHMRLRVREARKAYERTAVVCGAWHVPALTERTTATADRQLLKGLPKAKVETTWVPWTHRRLARASGYGAGIDSPGWYRHLFTARDRPVTRWMTKVAGLLREEDLPVSSAHVIEAVRLADTLAAMRGRPLAGLGETTDAVRAVMCDGSDVPLALIQDRLVVGDVLGEVPPDAPAVPLARDLAREQRRLRLKPEALEKELELDLRKEMDAGRSRLLHRLTMLGIGWGEPAVARHGKGTFRETWRLRWEPELAVRIAEAGIWGTTVGSAATAKAEDAAVHSDALAAVTSVAEQCLLAGLSDALPVVMRVLADRAALDADVSHLAAALPALVRAVRYGDVRGTDSAALGEVAEGLASRICVGFPPACVGLDADGAAALRTHMDEVHRAIGLLPSPTPHPAVGPGPAVGPAQTDAPAPASEPASGTAPAPETAPATAPASGTAPGSGRALVSGASPQGRGDAPGGDLRERWAGTLRGLAERDGAIPGLLRGAATRLLMDDGRIEAEDAARLMGLALSPGTGPAEGAAWIEGFLSGGGMLLVHDERLLALVDGWLAAVPATAFNDVLPLLRRTFADFETGVRRSVGELVRRGPSAARRPATASDPGLPGFGTGLDAARADAVLHTVRLLLGTTTTTDLAARLTNEGDQADD